MKYEVATREHGRPIVKRGPCEGLPDWPRSSGGHDSVPARTRYRGRVIKGFLTMRDSAIVFVPMTAERGKLV